MPEKRVAEVMALSEREAIRSKTLLVRSLVVLALVLTGFVFHSTLHVEPSVVALLGAELLVLISKIPTEEAIADVEWETLVFFMGLFVMVGALVKTGVIAAVSGALADATSGQPLLAVMALLVISAVLSGIVDNILCRGDVADRCRPGLGARRRSTSGILMVVTGVGC